jgi:hypothetical protein
VVRNPDVSGWVSDPKTSLSQDFEGAAKGPIVKQL